MRLDEHASDVTSQFGEDGCIEHILSVIGEHSGVCVEFGAGDGIDCSNTARLWRDLGWKAFLVEPDPDRYERLEGNTLHHDVVCRRTHVTPEGPESIGALLDEHQITDVDVMSIDVDGDDIFILEHLTVLPRLIVCEFNPTVPPHLALRPETTGSTFGASLVAIVRAGAELGYRFVGATYCNAFLVHQADAAAFDDGYETEPSVLFGPEQYSYAVTDFAGRILLTGHDLPWGARAPYVLGLEGAPIAPATDSVQQLRRGFESLWGPARWLPADGLDRQRLAGILEPDPPLVCVDVSTLGQKQIDLLARWAEPFPYVVLRYAGVLGLIRRSDA